MGDHVILFPFDYLKNHVVDKFKIFFLLVSFWLVYKRVFVTLKNTFTCAKLLYECKVCEN